MFSLDESDRNTNPKLYYLTRNTDIGICRVWNWTCFESMYVINKELEFDLNNPFIHIEEEIISIIDERNYAIDHKPIKEVDNVQIEHLAYE